MGEMHADLVGSSGLERDLETCVTRKTLDDTESRDSRLAVRPDRHSGASHAIATNRGVHGCARGG